MHALLNVNFELLVQVHALPGNKVVYQIDRFVLRKLPFVLYTTVSVLLEAVLTKDIHMPTDKDDAFEWHDPIFAYSHNVHSPCSNCPKILSLFACFLIKFV